MTKPLAPSKPYSIVRNDIVALLQAVRQTAARSVNTLMTTSYWEIGRRIMQAEQKGKRRASYGEQLIQRLSLDLTQQFGRGFSVDNLEHMRLFYMLYPAERISETLPRISGQAGVVQISETPSRIFSLPQPAQTPALSGSDGKVMYAVV